MTQIASRIIKCPKCGAENNILYYASINTFLDLDGRLIDKLIDGTLNTNKCKNCGILIRLSTDIMINAPSGMFYLNPTDGMEYKKTQLKKYGILSENGRNLSGPVSLFVKSKRKLEAREEYKPSPRPPPAPKISAHTQIYNELRKILSEKMSPNIRKDKQKSELKDEKKRSDPPPPPPPPSKA